MKIFKFLHKPNKNDYIREYMRQTIPQYIILSNNEDAYMHGVDSAIINMGYNPYTDMVRGDIWIRGYWRTKEIIKEENDTI